MQSHGKILQIRKVNEEGLVLPHPSHVLQNFGEEKDCL